LNNKIGRLSHTLNAGAIDAAAAAAAEVARNRISAQGEFLGNGHHARQQTAGNVVASVANVLAIK
jgi:hypothetical protein